MRQTGAVNARKALWRGDGAKHDLEDDGENLYRQDDDLFKPYVFQRNQEAIKGSRQCAAA